MEAGAEGRIRFLGFRQDVPQGSAAAASARTSSPRMNAVPDAIASKRTRPWRRRSGD